VAATAAVILALALVGCGGRADDAGGRPGGAPPNGSAAGQWGQGPGGGDAAAVPVEVAAVSRQPVSAYIETNGTLEAENDVEIVARTQGPIVELLTEEGRQVAQDQVMARIDPSELRAQVKIAEVALQEAKRAYQRAKDMFAQQLISQADFDAATSARESAEATLLDRQVQLGFTEIKAPFAATVSSRTVKLGDNVTTGEALFRITDFDPLLCKIQVPEKELPRLHKGQGAYLTVEAWPKERFPAQVARISPVVDAATGTIRVTLEVQGRDKLRPGMFASVYLEVDRHDDALTIPKAALSLESLGDTVYVANGEVASRRAVKLGFQEADRVEVLSGVEAGDRVITVGQDGLSDGTPIQVLEGPGALPTGAAPAMAGQVPPTGGPAAGSPGGPPAAADTAGVSPRQGAGGWGGGPPPQALSACQGKAKGDDCAFTTPRGEMKGTCQPRRDSPDQLSCRPSGWGGPRGSGS
jgi:membrane fusion protein (multidrug efflux system)